jgi:hypothetical protein
LQMLDSITVRLAEARVGFATLPCDPGATHAAAPEPMSMAQAVA